MLSNRLTLLVHIVVALVILVLPHEAHGLDVRDPIQVEPALSVIDITPYVHRMRHHPSAYFQSMSFALQNIGNASIDMILTRPEVTGVMLPMHPDMSTQLRLFNSEDTEYMSPAYVRDRIEFSLPPNAVQSFTLILSESAAQFSDERLWLWSSGARAKFDRRRLSARAFQTLLIGIFIGTAFLVVLLRRSLTAGIMVTSASVLSLAPLLIWQASLATSLGFGQLDVQIVPSVILLLILLAVGIFILGHIYGVSRSREVNYWRWALFFLDANIILTIGFYAIHLYRPWFLGPFTSDVFEGLFTILICGFCFSVIFMPARRLRQEWQH